MPITLKNCGTPFLSSISLIFVLTSIPFGFSSLVIGGFTWIMRHCGSTVGLADAPWFAGIWVGLVFGVGRFGLAGLAATVAHIWLVPFIGVATVFGSQAVTCVLCASFVSRVLILFVRYALVSAMCVMVVMFGVPVLAFPFKAESFLYHAAYPSFSHGFSSFICLSLPMMYSMVFLICTIQLAFMCSKYESELYPSSMFYVCISSFHSSSSSSGLYHHFCFASVCFFGQSLSSFGY